MIKKSKNRQNLIWVLQVGHNSYPNIFGLFAGEPDVWAADEVWRMKVLDPFFVTSS